MPLELVVGPAGSGKTEAAVVRALEVARGGERAVVLTLPGQREAFLARLAGAGPSLGVEVTSLQGLCYRLLDRLGENQPVLLNPGRVALTARVLEGVLGRPAGPGEARLYARAVAECKRHNAVPESVGEEYRDTLALVYRAYAAALAAEGLQDLDDVRSRAAERLAARPVLLGAHLVVDGYRSLNPGEVDALAVLARLSPSSLLTLPGGPPDAVGEAWAHPLRAADLAALARRLSASVRRLPPRGGEWAGLPPEVRFETHPSPVEEARAVLRSVKERLLAGAAPAEVAVLVPNPAAARVLEALGREYGVPVAPEVGGSCLETPDGRRLEALLAAPARGYPARDLRALGGLHPGLGRLADALESAGLPAGSAAHALVCPDPEAGEALARLRGEAEPPQSGTPAELVAWFEGLLARHLPGAGFLDAARVVAREAARVLAPDAEGQIEGPAYADWLRALLSGLPADHPDRGRGVAVLGPEEASGRRFRFAYVTGANDGAYSGGEGEDFFVPEEERFPLERLLAGRGAGTSGLPAHLAGLEDAGLYDALTRADEALVVTYPRAERGAPLRPHPRLAGLTASSPPGLRPTASPHEVAAAGSEGLPPRPAAWRLSPRPTTDALKLERAAVCGLRAWAEELVPAPRRGSGLVSGELLAGWSRGLRRAAWRGETGRPDEAAPPEHRERIASFAPAFRERLEAGLLARVPAPPGNGVVLGYRANLDGLEYRLDGVRLHRTPEGRTRAVEVYRAVENAAEGYDAYMDRGRHREWWFAGAWLERDVPVSFWAWDGGPPRRVFGLEKPYAKARLEHSRVALAQTRADLESGEVRPSPGRHCLGCAYRDLCREAV